MNQHSVGCPTISFRADLSGEPEERHAAFVAAVDFYETLFPNDAAEKEVRTELAAVDNARLFDVVQDPADKLLVRDIRRVLGPRRRLPSLSSEEREDAVKKDSRCVRSVLVASWLEILRMASARASDFVRLDQSLLPPYAPDDDGTGEGSWRTGVVSMPTVYFLRREASGRVFDAFISQVRAVLDEKGEFPLFACPKTTIKKSSSGYLVLLG
ncbi:MAG: hypothetical protein A3D65_05330 [Candidatus Lloydbacteria bacterium RIFCSPHIGHO2_02_FULL_50_13]|uniref:Uncharacterized protein n=1 Tax=Candidatus Lloydbacteria bacterium RIFCSPHIGHO2_02_FULL_50_13 TaxID=1798661 RepID=A0A1G2D9W6_9BACT|nr:MAG: hypothetical protein A3D65_05330 [Candidatus Lloydbacteria bacterium RIFCSPHIGHO2_02_FULL_50_13]